MAESRRKPPLWRRYRPANEFDIAKIRPKTSPRGKRFETPEDARKESLRSETLLVSYRPRNPQSGFLSECREGHYYCEKPYCPQCGRAFRRFLTSELLRLHSDHQLPATILTVLLEAAPRGKLLELKIDRYRDSLRKRLDRAGLGDAAVVGGFEMIYRARPKEWVLHINLVIFGGTDKAIQTFARDFSGGHIDRAIQRAALDDPAEQLSYILKFTTYHRPHEQRGSKKSKAVPLNPAEHYALVKWMDQHQFLDYLFLFNARRRGPVIELGTQASLKAVRNA
jgi:hypothetical protein